MLSIGHLSFHLCLLWMMTASRSPKWTMTASRSPGLAKWRNVRGGRLGFHWLREVKGPMKCPLSTLCVFVERQSNRPAFLAFESLPDFFPSLNRDILLHFVLNRVICIELLILLAQKVRSCRSPFLVKGLPKPTRVIDFCIERDAIGH